MSDDEVVVSLQSLGDHINVNAEPIRSALQSGGSSDYDRGYVKAVDDILREVGRRVLVREEAQAERA